MDISERRRPQDGQGNSSPSGVLGAWLRAYAL